MNPVACRLLSSKYYLVYNSVRRKYEDKTKGFNFSSNILENSCSKEETPQVPTRGKGPINSIQGLELQGTHSREPGSMFTHSIPVQKLSSAFFQTLLGVLLRYFTLSL
jgi:hypothetical protein